jgi:shikimate kinase
LQREVDRKHCVALIGARGSGKTTVGRLLAEILNVRYVDIDDMVIASSGRTIRRIFAEQGENEFRRLESDAVLLATATKTPAVISMGGGAVMDPANMSEVCRVARIVWLAAPANVLVNRMAQDAKSGENRPSLTKHDPLTEMDEVLRLREPLYRATADFIVDTSQMDAGAVAQRIANWMKQDSSLRSE